MKNLTERELQFYNRKASSALSLNFRRKKNRSQKLQWKRIKTTTASKCQTCSVKRNRDLLRFFRCARVPTLEERVATIQEERSGWLHRGAYFAPLLCRKGMIDARERNGGVASTADCCQENSFGGKTNGGRRRKAETGTTRHGFSLCRTTGDCLYGRSRRWRKSNTARVPRSLFYIPWRGCNISSKYIFFGRCFFKRRLNPKLAVCPRVPITKVLLS